MTSYAALSWPATDPIDGYDIFQIWRGTGTNVPLASCEKIAQLRTSSYMDLSVADSTDYTYWVIDKTGNTTGTLIVAGPINITSLPLSGSGSVWTLVDSWSWSTNVAEVDFTGLTGYQDLMIVMRNVTLSVSGSREIDLTHDNGSTWFTTGYIDIDSNGNERVTNTFLDSATPTTAAKSGIAFVFGWSLSGHNKVITIPSRGFIRIIPDTNPLNGFRIVPSAGGNIIGGSIEVFAR